MKIKFYNLMYVDLEEKRQISGKKYTSVDRIDLYLKGSCALDKSLIINEMGGVNILTNNRTVLSDSLLRIGYKDLNIIEIPFSLDVPKGIPFYSAHYKIDVFNYLSNRPLDEYSILLDSDVICLKNFDDEFYSIVKEGIPTVYYLDRYGGTKKLSDVKSIVSDVEWLPWAGGEFIGGISSFFRNIYEEIMSFKENYWKVVNNGLFHVGDEMLTTIALARLRKRGVYPVDVKLFGVIHRYWSVFESKEPFDYNVPLIHLPSDKVFEKDIDLSADTVKGLMKGYPYFHFKQRLKNHLKRYLKH